jgi:hypothetical protein
LDGHIDEDFGGYLLRYLKEDVDKLLDWDMDGSVMGGLVGDLDGLLHGDFRINLMAAFGGMWMYPWMGITMTTCWG